MTSGGAVMSNQQLAEELSKAIFRKFGKWKVYSSFTENIWGGNVEDIRLISKFH